MILVPDQGGRQRMKDREVRAHDHALGAIRERARTNAPRRSGEFAGSLEWSRTDTHGYVFSRLPQAGAVERGADVGARRGPHMEGSHVIADAGREFPELMTAAIRGG